MDSEPNLPDNLAIAITFFYVDERLSYLHTMSRHLDALARKVKIFVITNVADSFAHDRIKAAIGDMDIEIVVPNWLGHPYLLTWVHREVFKQQHETQAFSHYLYVEDDLEVKPDNILYWARAREDLKPYGLVPSFLRYELSPAGHWVSTDVTKGFSIRESPQVKMGERYYVNLRQPYQGMYLMDRELMSEFVSSPAFSPDFGHWHIREKATQGLTFYKVPKNCFSRNFVGYLSGVGIDSGALVHHLPNNYAHNPNSKFGKLLLADVIRP